MRHRFISDLVKELLGPRGGAIEQFPLFEDPRNEYATGQLIPPNMVVDRAPEDEESLGAEIGGGGEEAEEENAVTFVNQAMIDSGQNFRRIPSSMGLSFVLSDMPAKGEIKVCATWGRYQVIENIGWLRQPNYWINVFEGGDNEQLSPNGDIRLTYKLTKVKKDNTVKVSIYLSSAIDPGNEHRVRSDQIIFQPEVRVLLKDPSNLRELGDLGFLTDDPEWRLSTRQYDKFQVFARGHLCGAYWKEIDPQRKPDNANQSSKQTPFAWVDGEHFLPAVSELADFLYPDIRTDFIPMYSAPAPSIEKEKLDLRADMLAECKSPEILAEALTPLIKNYQTWIDGLRPNQTENSPDTEIVRRHNEAIARIKSGIEFLMNDRDAYCAFLFMNKAMALQYKWGKKPGKEVMHWRPFQLAFILLSLPSTASTSSPDRKICDTIWFPTGGGKTEAYLGLTAFALAYRRRVSSGDDSESKGGEGICVISRYTLRLLTIQQFRRALKMIMACEILRCQSSGGSLIGWAPTGVRQSKGMIWGRSPFSIGLWVGSKVTPNKLDGKRWKNIGSDGAIELLKYPARGDSSDPAQIIECPVCASTLSMSVDGVRKGIFTLHTLVHADRPPPTDVAAKASLSKPRFDVSNISYDEHESGRCGYLKIEFDLKESLSPRELEGWWQDKAEIVLGVRLCSLNITRPGYFPLESQRGKITDYEIRCPNKDCELNHENFSYRTPSSKTSWDWGQIHPFFKNPKYHHSGFGIPINAITVDAKLYSFPPSMLISTCDKFAMTAFMNDAAALFGRVRSYGDKGYSQENATQRSRRFAVDNFAPPSLIIQDELHLLEGPLGSSFGIYETIIEKLCDNPKYIASSATIRNSREQVSALMGRQSQVFPPVGLDISDGFFLRSNEAHPLDETKPGRLFLGLAFPGRAPQTPMLRTWGRLLQSAHDLKNEGADPADLDYFWTLVGYFNAVRELAQAETLLRQDIPQYLDKLQRQVPGTVKRDLPIDGFRNLSSQTDSSELPGILATMERTILQEGALNSVAATSMFGTGVDVARLSMMIIHGQPKSASQYIQAVGRIGRQRAGLAIVFFRVSKPRDLNHYEYFTGYHRKLPVAVEPITVKPLAPKALDRSLGALLAILARNWRDDTIVLPPDIDLEENGAFIYNAPSEFLQEIRRYFAEKWQEQPPNRRPPDREMFLDDVQSKYERWLDYARRQLGAGQALHYSKGGGLVMLGADDQSPCVFPNVPKSLREVEPTISIYTRDG